MAKKYLSLERLTEYDALIKNYADSAANAVKDDLLNGAGEAYDTLKELGDLIKENTDALDALETVATGKADSDHTHDEYLTAIPEEYVTETELTAKGYATNAYVNEVLGDIESLLAQV